MSREPLDRRDGPAATDRPPRTSPWPLFVALGLATTEIGVLFGSPPAAIGGALLLGGSAAAAVAEAGYAAAPWGPLAVAGVLLGVLGLAGWLLGTASPWTVGAFIRAPTSNGVAYRGATVLIAGVQLVAVGALGGTGRLDRLVRAT